jgi:3-polyprenyl-4-hydroxybenzoate decarboxylase
MFSSKSNRVRVFEVSVVVWNVLNKINTIRDLLRFSNFENTYLFFWMG